MKKLVILDFDGTLADTRELIIRTNEEAMRRMGYPIKDEETIAATIGLILEEGLLQMYPDLPRETLPVWVKTYREIFEELRTQIAGCLSPGAGNAGGAVCEGCHAQRGIVSQIQLPARIPGEHGPEPIYYVCAWCR